MATSSAVYNDFRLLTLLFIYTYMKMAGLSVSCYCIVVDIVVMSGRRVSLPTQYLVSGVHLCWFVLLLRGVFCEKRGSC